MWTPTPGVVHKLFLTSSRRAKNRMMMMINLLFADDTNALAGESRNKTKPAKGITWE